MSHDDEPDRAHIEEVEVDPATPPETQKEVIKAEIDNASRGRHMGLLILLIGVALVVLGVTGVVNFDFEAEGFKGQLQSASPGILLMIIGAVVVWRTNLKITKAKT